MGDRGKIESPAPIDAAAATELKPAAGWLVPLPQDVEILAPVVTAARPHDTGALENQRRERKRIVRTQPRFLHQGARLDEYALPIESAARHLSHPAQQFRVDTRLTPRGTV